MNSVLADMLLGTFEPKIDAKGRMILPAKFREILKNGVVIAKGQELCLSIYKAEEFQKIYSEISVQPIASEQARAFRRILTAGAIDTIPDKQGRIPIPKNLREYAKLEGDLVCVGVGERAEIWNKARWDKYEKANEIAFSRANDGIFES